MPLATVEELAAQLAIDFPSSAQTAILERLVASASASFESLTGRKFEVATYTDSFTGNGTSSRHVVARDPLISVSAVAVDGTTATGWSIAGDVVVLAEGEVFQGECSVTYSAGYATIPADVKEAVLELASWKYNARKMATTGGEAGFVPVLQTPASIQAAVDSYLVRGIA